MTDQEPMPAGVPPTGPGTEWEQRNRAEILADWIESNSGSFTNAALRRSAEASGYSSEDFDGASRLIVARAGIAPLRSNVRIAVLAAYGLVWAGFAVIFLGQASQRSFGPMLLFILTISMTIALAISLATIRRGRPNPEHRWRAVALLLVIPVVLLLGVAGLCLPFTKGVVI